VQYLDTRALKIRNTRDCDTINIVKERYGQRKQLIYKNDIVWSQRLENSKCNAQLAREQMVAKNRLGNFINMDKLLCSKSNKNTLNRK
jgi:hypothetical protein